MDCTSILHGKFGLGLEVEDCLRPCREVKECERVWLLAADVLAGSRAGAQARARKGLLGLEAHGILALLKLDKHPAHTQTTKVLYN